MRTVQSLRDQLAKFPADAVCYAYEGEVAGVVVRTPDGQELGCIFCRERAEADNQTELRLSDGQPCVYSDDNVLPLAGR